MKTFWRQSAIFGGVLMVVAGMVLLLFYFNGMGSSWVAHQTGGASDRRIIGGDITALQKIVTECEQNPATKAEIEEYTSTSEWQGFVFINTKTNTVYAFSKNLGILAIYETSGVEDKTQAGSLPDTSEASMPEIDPASFRFYRCPAAALAQVEGIYNKYYQQKSPG